MHFSTPIEPTLLLEQHLERQALAACRPASFLGVLRVYGIAPTLPVPQPKGGGTLLRASDIFAARTKWLAHQDLGPERTCLAEQSATLIPAFHDWLTTAYTQRYRELTTDAQRTWLSQVTLLVVVRTLMEEKRARLLAEGRQTFADPWAGSVMCHLRLYHHLIAEIAHLLKQREVPEQWPSLIGTFLEALDIRMWAHPVVQPEMLPPLPKEAHLPFVLPVLLPRTQGKAFQARKGDA